MNKNKLKQAEHAFMMRYPGGFHHPDMVAIGKKHKVEQIVSETQETFSKNLFRKPKETCEQFARLVARSSMVSVFEKAKFRDFARSLDSHQQETLSGALQQLLYGSEQQGFEALTDFLATGKLAKWPLVTVCQAYFRPLEDVFIKPTTAKGVIAFFELDIPKYTPKPNWEFYSAYRDAITSMRSSVDQDLAPSNAAFCGFLMMALE